MKKAFNLIASIFFALCVFIMPGLIFTLTDPSGENLFFACFLSAVSGLASYLYFLNYKNQ